MMPIWQRSNIASSRMSGNLACPRLYILFRPIRPANEMYNAKLSISFVSEPERKALSFLTSPERFLSDHCLHLLSLCAAFSLLTMARTCLFFPLPLVFGA